MKHIELPSTGSPVQVAPTGTTQIAACPFSFGARVGLSKYMVNAGKNALAGETWLAKRNGARVFWRVNSAQCQKLFPSDSSRTVPFVGWGTGTGSSLVYSTLEYTSTPAPPGGSTFPADHGFMIAAAVMTCSYRWDCIKGIGLSPCISMLPLTTKLVYTEGVVDATGIQGVVTNETEPTIDTSIAGFNEQFKSVHSRTAWPHDPGFSTLVMEADVRISALYVAFAMYQYATNNNNQTMQDMFASAFLELYAAAPGNPWIGSGKFTYGAQTHESAGAPYYVCGSTARTYNAGIPETEHDLGAITLSYTDTLVGSVYTYTRDGTFTMPANLVYQQSNVCTQTLYKIDIVALMAKLDAWYKLSPAGTPLVFPEDSDFIAITLTSECSATLAAGEAVETRERKVHTVSGPISDIGTRTEDAEGVGELTAQVLKHDGSVSACAYDSAGVLAEVFTYSLSGGSYTTREVTYDYTLTGLKDLTNPNVTYSDFAISASGPVGDSVILINQPIEVKYITLTGMYVYSDTSGDIAIDLYNSVPSDTTSGVVATDSSKLPIVGFDYTVTIDYIADVRTTSGTMTAITSYKQMIVGSALVLRDNDFIPAVMVDAEGNLIAGAEPSPVYNKYQEQTKQLHELYDMPSTPRIKTTDVAYQNYFFGRVFVARDEPLKNPDGTESLHGALLRGMSYNLIVP